MSEDIYFGKLLAKRVGIDLDELNASVEESKREQINKRSHINFNNQLD